MHKQISTLLLTLLLFNSIYVSYALGMHFTLSQVYTVEEEAESLFSGVFDGIRDLFIHDMCLGPDLNAYSICTHSSEGDDGLKSVLHIVKWNQEAQPIWATVWNTNGSVYPDKIISSDDGIFITGRYSENSEMKLFLLCYSHSGEELWVRYFSEGVRNEGYSLATTKDGSIYVGGHVRWNIMGAEEWNASAIILKYDSSGELLWQWERDLGEYFWYLQVNALVSHDESIYVEIPGFHYLEKLNPLDGSVLDGISIENSTYYHRHKISPSGDFVSAEGGLIYQISWFNTTTGTEEWSYEPPLIWSLLGPSIEQNGGFDIAPDNSVYTLCKLQVNENDTWILTKFDERGSMLWTRSLNFDDFFVRGIEVANDGSIYIGSGTAQGDIVLHIYKIGEFTPYWQTTSSTGPSISPTTPPEEESLLMLILLILGIVGIIIVVLLIIRKRIHKAIDENWIDNSSESSISETNSG